ncbi:DUF4350 domain-containing protein [Leptolyngbya sp. FACHB-17]|uniref:DUF4350 domain-containing protein n=1 Tax=unclassified Leptolyngbya TaxID=2650499 RepID=UPI0016814520|nr:DUF4350 domain-containing protein [Leptolyngbya sp. FACHB-17]MBD2081401.1 DUF4350 domain-containing protein [Leptolyngbya sp. FACHB-17]
MKKLDRRLVFGLIALAVIISLTLFIAPRSNRITSGSTFSRSPDGYGAWYAYMQRQGTPVERWRKTIREIEQISGTGNTMIQVDPSGLGMANPDLNWIDRGNTWIVLGGRDLAATEAGFSTQHESDRGLVKIETSRRLTSDKGIKRLLGDRFGSIVWEEPKGKGRIIYAVTSFLAANAYQDEPGNFPFLAQLVTGKKIWIDEYLHGYRDETAKTESRQSWLGYLLGTPLSVVLLQAIVLSIVLIWAKNRRFGQAQPIETSRVNDSEAYTQALAGVLYKAGRSEFVVDVVGREEQLQIQRSLGLGGVLVDREVLIKAWVEQTGRPAAELAQLFPEKQRLSEQELIKWLAHLKEIRQSFPWS